MAAPRPALALRIWAITDTRVYEIRVQGELTPRWSCWFAGLAVETADGETVIVGPVDDQAALHGAAGPHPRPRPAAAGGARGRRMR